MTDVRHYNIDDFFYNQLLNDEREASEANLPRVLYKNTIWPSGSIARETDSHERKKNNVEQVSTGTL